MLRVFPPTQNLVFTTSVVAPTAFPIADDETEVLGDEELLMLVIFQVSEPESLLPNDVSINFNDSFCLKAIVSYPF